MRSWAYSQAFKSLKNADYAHKFQSQDKRLISLHREPFIYCSLKGQMQNLCTLRFEKHELK